MFFGTSILKGFGEVLGRFWEAKILNFRIFFDDFSKQILEDVSEGEKIEKNRKKERPPEVRRRFWAGPAECAEPGGEIERGKSEI